MKNKKQISKMQIATIILLIVNIVWLIMITWYNASFSSIYNRHHALSNDKDIEYDHRISCLEGETVYCK